MGKVNPKPVFRIQKINNLSVVLSFIKDQGIRIENLGPDDICDGNLKMIMGLVWTLISHYQLQELAKAALDNSGPSSNVPVTSSSAKQTILNWVSERLAGSGVKVTNLTTDWQDGRVLALLVHSLDPNVWTGASDSQSDEAALARLERALLCLENDFGVPHIVDAQDIHRHPDEKSMMTFLGEMMKSLGAEGTLRGSSANFNFPEMLKGMKPQDKKPATPDPRKVDADELSLVNMLYSSGPSVTLYDESGAKVLEASRAEDFDIGRKYFTANGTSCLRTEEGVLLVDGVRQIPLELVVNEGGTELTEMVIPEEALPPTPNSPGFKRLTEIRKTKERDLEKRKSMDISRLMREEEERRQREEEERRQREEEERRQREEEERRQREEEEERRQREAAAARRKQQEEEEAAERERQRRQEEAEERRRRREAEEEEERQRRRRQEEEEEEERRRVAAQEELRLQEEEERKRREEEERRRLLEEEEEAARRKQREEEEEEERRRRLEEEEEERRRQQEEEDQRRQQEELERRMHEEEEERRRQERLRLEMEFQEEIDRQTRLAKEREEQQRLEAEEKRRAEEQEQARAMQEESSEEKLPLVAVLGAETAVGAAALKEFDRMGAGEHFNVRAIATGEGELKFPVSDTRHANTGDNSSLVEALDGATRALIILTKPSDAETVFRAAKEQKVESVTLLSKINDAEFAQVESTIANILGSDCSIVRAYPTFEDLVSACSVSSDGKKLLTTMPSCEALPVSNLGSFCAEVTVRDGMDGHVLQVGGIDRIGGREIAKFAGLTYDGEEEVVPASSSFAEVYEDVMDSKPRTFDTWLSHNGAQVSMIHTRKQASMFDLIALREVGHPNFGTPCRLCNAPISVVRWSTSCCQCDQITCRKCLVMLPPTLSLAKPTYSKSSFVCDKCLPAFVRRIEEAGQASGDIDLARREISLFGVALNKKSGQCSVCTRAFEGLRGGSECSSCNEPVCHACFGRITSEILDFPDSQDNILCENCVPELKAEIREGVEESIGAKELLGLDMVTLGISYPKERVIFPRDFTPEEQSSLVDKGKNICHVCDDAFSQMTPPHRCFVCSRLVCDSDSAAGINSDLLALNNARVCSMCVPLLKSEILLKKKGHENLADAELNALTDAFVKKNEERNAKRLMMRSLSSEALPVVAPALPQSPPPSSPPALPSGGVGVVSSSPSTSGGSAGAHCQRCDRELTMLTRSCSCILCREPVCSGCAYHFRCTVLGWKTLSSWVCNKCVPNFQAKIVAVGREKPKQSGGAAAVEVFPPRVVQNGGVFAPLEEPEYFEFSLKDIKTIESGKGKCYVCESKFDVFCNPRRCGKCRKVVCTRCTESFRSLGFVLQRAYGEVSICKDCWPGVKLEIQDMGQRHPDVARELEDTIALGDKSLLPGGRIPPHPLEAQFKAKSMTRHKCTECTRKSSALRGLSQCKQCQQIFCTTCTGRYYVPDMGSVGLTRLCMGCAGKLKAADKIKPLPETGAYVRRSLQMSSLASPGSSVAPDSKELIEKFPNCKNCEKSFDMFRKQHFCVECEAPSCWQCCTKSYRSGLLGKEVRVCIGCIPEFRERLVVAGANDELAWVEGQEARLRSIDHNDENLVDSDEEKEKMDRLVEAGSTSDRRPTFLQRTFSRRIKDPTGAGGCHLCQKPFGLTRKEKMCAECSSSVCTGCSADILLQSFKWPVARRVCDKCVPGLRVRVAELADNPYEFQNVASDLKALDARVPPTGTVAIPKKPVDAPVLAMEEVNDVKAERSSVASPRDSETLSADQQRAIDEGKSCSQCANKFTFFRRPYWCQQCESVVCRSCSESESSGRVCVSCKDGRSASLAREKLHPHDAMLSRCPGCKDELGFAKPLTECPNCRSPLCADCVRKGGCPECVESNKGNDVHISLPRQAMMSPRFDEIIPDLEVSGCGMCPEDFKWKDRGMPIGLSRKEEVEYKLKHIEETLKRLDMMEDAIRNE